MSINITVSKAIIGKADEISIVKDALNSVRNPYDYLVDDFFPKLLGSRLRDMGVEDFELTSKINLSQEDCLKYSKTQLLQWYLRVKVGDKSLKRLICEFPVINGRGVGIINGYQKVFVIKFKRRNLYFWSGDGLRTCHLTSLRNRFLRVMDHGDRIEINFNGKPYSLVQFLLGIFDVSEVASALWENVSHERIEGHESFHDLWVSKRKLGDRFYADLKPIVDEISPEREFLLLNRDHTLLEYLLGKEVPKNIMHIDTLISLCGFIGSASDIYFSEFNLINKSWITLGGFLKDIVERSLLGDGKEAKRIDSAADPSALFEQIFSNLNLKTLRSQILLFYQDGSFTQILEDNNPISEIIHSRKVSLLFKGLISRLSATLDIRDTNPYYWGRFCSISTSEGQAIGLIRQLTLVARFNRFEELEVPYCRVVKGKVRTKIHWLNCFEEIDMKITDLFNFQSSEELIKYKVNNLIMIGRREEIDLVCPINGFSNGLGINLLPRVNASEPDRTLMSSNMLRQSLILKNSQRPLFSSFLNGVVNDLLSHSVRQGDNRLVYFSSNMAIFRNEGGNYNLMKGFTVSKNNSKTVRMLKFRDDLDRSCINKSLPDNMVVPYASKSGSISLGNNLRCGYMMWNGYNFEDSTVVSERVIKEELLNSINVEEFNVPVFKTIQGRERVTREVLHTYRYDLSKLDENGVIRVGSFVKAGDILVTKVKPVKKKNDSPEQRLLLSILGERNLSVRNNFFTLPQDINSATILDVSYDRGRITNKAFEQWSELSIDRINSERREVLMNLARTLDQKRAGEIVDSWLNDGGELKDFPKSSVKPILEHFNNRVKEVFNSISKEDCLFSIRITIAIDKPIEIGDKLTGLHGNKAVISRIVPVEDMPFDELGRPLDIVISNLSAYGRLNYSQMQESRIGGLSVSLRDWIRKHLYHGSYSSSSQAKLERLREILSLNKRDFKQLLLEVERDGFYFEERNYEYLNRELLGNLEEISGFREGLRLRCGLTGQSIDRPVHVGWIHVLKLVHTVDSKESSRSIGSNSIKFNQPTRGKLFYDQNKIISDGRAQKIGTMEKDALIARGLSYFLQEMFSIRSDVISLRRKILNGEFRHIDLSQEWILTESTKAFFNYLFCLGIKVNIVKDGHLPKSLSFSLLKQEEILRISKGRVYQTDTLHYRTKRGINGGLFCPIIFGSDKNYSCECEKYVGSRYADLTCSICGVRVTSNKVRRNFIGHIELACPLVNIKLIKEKIVRIILDVPTPLFNRLISRKSFLKIDREGRWTELKEWEYPETGFRILSGGEAFEFLASNVNLRSVYRSWLIDLRRGSKKVPREFIDELADFINTGNDLSDMIVRYIPVMPKCLRPLMFTGSGSYISTDINSLYLDIIRRNNRLNELKKYNLLQWIIEQSKISLQESYNALLWGDTNSKFVSISDQIKGKQGVCRQHLLSKRINCSGRSTLILDPNIPMGFCKINRNILLRIMLPLIQDEIVNSGRAETFYDAFDMLKDNSFNADEFIEKACRIYPVLFNRNPTLHSLSIQSFYVIPSDSRGIAIHPLVCPALGADFDGDTGSVYVPFLDRSREELLNKVYDLNAFNPSNYEFVIKPIKEVALGIYLFTLTDDRPQLEGLYSCEDVERLMFIHGPNRSVRILRDSRILETTLGRIYLVSNFERIMDRRADEFEVNTFNQEFNAGVISNLIKVLNPFNCPISRIFNFMDFLKMVGNRSSMISGSSFLTSEVESARVDWDRHEYLSELFSLQERLRKGLIDSEQFNDLMITQWYGVEDRIAEGMKESLRGSMHELIVNSGFRGSWSNMMGLSCSRGLITVRKGLNYPVIDSLSMGYSEIDFLTLSTVMRKLITKSLGTSKGGYFNRKLVEFLRECKISEHDCGVEAGVVVDIKGIRYLDLVGRIISCKKTATRLGIEGPIDFRNAIYIKENERTIELRSPLKCQSKSGVCQVCFGYVPGESDYTVVNRSVGTLAAHSLAEPVTQMLMKVKHLRNIDLGIDEMEVRLKSPLDGTFKLDASPEDLVRIGDSGLRFMGKYRTSLSVGEWSHEVYYGDNLMFSDGDSVSMGDVLKSSPVKESLYSDIDGRLSVGDASVTVNGETKQVFYLSPEDRYNLMFKDGDSVKRGDIVFQIWSDIDDLHLDSSFNILNKLLNSVARTRELNLFNYYAEEDCSIKLVKGVMIVNSKASKKLFYLSKRYSVIYVNGGAAKKGQLLFRGSEGDDPLDNILSGRYDKGFNYFVNEISNIYLSEGVKLQRVYIELLVREMTMKYVYKGELVNYFYMLGNGVECSPIQRKINQVYLDKNSPLAMITYEDIVRNVIRVSFNGLTDNLQSINSRLIIGLPTIID